jgi:hypothetical protein
METLMVTLLLWINAHGFPACVGLPEVNRVQSEQTHGYMAWYQHGVINLSDRFDYDGLFLDGGDKRVTLARSALVHEITHYCQEQREGPRRITEQGWLEREDEAYRLQTLYLRERGSSTVLVWRKDYEG